MCALDSEGSVECMGDISSADFYEQFIQNEYIDIEMGDQIDPNICVIDFDNKLHCFGYRFQTVGSDFDHIRLSRGDWTVCTQTDEDVAYCMVDYDNQPSEHSGYIHIFEALIPTHHAG